MRKKLIFPSIFIILSTLMINIPISAQTPLEDLTTVNPDQYQKGYRFNNQGWIYLHIEGDPYERGYQHGYLLSSEIIDMLNRWSYSIHNNPKINRINKLLSETQYNKIAKIWWDFCATQCNRIYWKNFPEEYQQEIQGIADGVTARGGHIHDRDVNYKDILALNEMYEFMSKLDRLRKGVHPLRTLLHQLKKVTPELSETTESDFLASFFHGTAHHCNGFIATGDATTDGQMIVSHSTICGGTTWWWTNYICLRWNVIIDIQPTDGNRVIMSGSPGLIWSDEDYYQNDNGIVLIETTLPQGLWDNRGLPLSVRARRAMQYGNNIDDVIYHLRYRNDGSMNAVWLIGDKKTGEISRFELGYDAYEVWRTYNGFYWSANNPMSAKVNLEKFIFKNFLKRLLFTVFLRTHGLGYNTIRYYPEPRDIKYEELGNAYYGDIDSEVVKDIMSTSPIVDWITDIKVTDSNLLDYNGVWAFFGNPNRALNITGYDKKGTYTQHVQPTGWVRIMGLPSKDDFSLISQLTSNYGNSTKIRWDVDTKKKNNYFSTKGVVENNVLYIATSDGFLYAFEVLGGTKKWSMKVGNNPTKPVLNNGYLYIGHVDGISAIDTIGSKIWDAQGCCVPDSPLLFNDRLFFGDMHGNLFVLDAESGQELWKTKFPDEIHLAEDVNKYVFLTSGSSCYALYPNNYSILWRFDTKNLITSAPVLNNNTIFFGSWDTNIYALKADSGDLLWMFETGWGFDVSPVCSENKLYVGGVDGNLYVLDCQDGGLEWLFTAKASIKSQPVLYGENLFFGCDDGRFYALNCASGKPVWYFSPGYTIDDDVFSYMTTPIISDPVLFDSMVFIGVNGSIYALDAATSKSVFVVSEKTSDFLSGYLVQVGFFVTIVFCVFLVIIVLRKQNVKS